MMPLRGAYLLRGEAETMTTLGLFMNPSEIKKERLGFKEKNLK